MRRTLGRVVLVNTGVYAAIAACASGCGERARTDGAETARVTQAIHGGVPHTGKEPPIYDATMAMCAPFMGTVVQGYEDDILPPTYNAVNEGRRSVVRESAQGYGGGYAPAGFGPPRRCTGTPTPCTGQPALFCSQISGCTFEGTCTGTPDVCATHNNSSEACVNNGCTWTDVPELPITPQEPSEACQQQLGAPADYLRDVPLTRQLIHCSCVSEQCKLQFPNDEPAQAACTPNYRSCFFDHTSCKESFRVEVSGTARGWVQEVVDLPIYQAEIDAYYNDLNDPPTCVHEHGIYYAYVVGPGSDWTYIGSYASGSGAGDAPGQCRWQHSNPFDSFGIPPLVVADRGTRLRILATSMSHFGIHPCGYFGCNHPVGVRVDYTVQSKAQEAGGEQFWIGEDDQPLPPADAYSAGEASQIIPAAGVNVLRAPTLSSVDQTVMGDEVWLDLFVPESQANPALVGTAQLRVSIPSAGIASRSLGVKDLTPLSREQWSKLRFALGTEIRDILRQPHPDVTFSLVTTLSSTLAPTLVDNFRFATNLEQVGQSPVARCRNVGVPSGSSSTASVTPQMVDAGSSDPNGDALSLTLVPPGPFALGTTNVTLEASDGSNATQCNATVTVVDVAAAFSPQSLAPLAWYRASPDSVLASAGAVTEWQDSSGNGHHLVQSGSSARPQYSAAGWNGNSPVVTFDGVDDFLEYSVENGRLLTELAGEDNPFSVLVTWEPLDLDADYDLVQWDNGGENGGNSLIELRTNTTGPDEAKFRHRRGDGISSLLNTGSVKFTLARRTTAFVFDGTALSIYDGTATHMNASANDQGPLTLVRFRLGDGDNMAFNGRIAEVVVTSYALTNSMYQSYRGYAQQQWGGL